MQEWEIASIDVHDGLPAEWQALNERCMSAHPLLDPRFVNPLLRVYGGNEVRLARLRQGGVDVGMALVQPLGRFRWGLFRPSQAPLSLILIDRERVDSDSALQSLLRSLSSTAVELELTYMDPDYSPVLEPGPRVDRIQHATTIAVTLDGEFDTYWASRGKQLRYNLRSYDKKLQEAAMKPEFQVISSPEAVGAAVDEFGDLESAGWKGAAGTAIHRDNPQGRLYREILEGFAASGDGMVYRMTIGGQHAASWLIIMANGMAIMLKTTYDESRPEFALGRVNLHAALQHLFARGNLRVAEFYTNATAVWLQWGNVTRSIFHLSVYRWSAVRKAKALLRSARAVVRKPVSA